MKPKQSIWFALANYKWVAFKLEHRRFSLSGTENRRAVGTIRCCEQRCLFYGMQSHVKKHTLYIQIKLNMQSTVSFYCYFIICILVVNVITNIYTEIQKIKINACSYTLLQLILVIWFHYIWNVQSDDMLYIGLSSNYMLICKIWNFKSCSTHETDCNTSFTRLL